MAREHQSTKGGQDTSRTEGKTETDSLLSPEKDRGHHQVGFRQNRYADAYAAIHNTICGYIVWWKRI